MSRIDDSHQSTPINHLKNESLKKLKSEAENREGFVEELFSDLANKDDQWYQKHSDLVQKAIKIIPSNTLLTDSDKKAVNEFIKKMGSVEPAPLQINDPKQANALFQKAIKEKDETLALKLLRTMGPSLNLDKNDPSLLSFVCKNHLFKLADALIEEGYLPQGFSSWEWIEGDSKALKKVFELAMKHDDVQGAYLMMKLGMDPCGLNEAGRPYFTPQNFSDGCVDRLLFYCIHRGNEELALALLDHEHFSNPESVNILDDNHAPLLHRAMKHEMIDLTEKLLKLGADTHLKDSRGLDAWAYAQSLSAEGEFHLSLIALLGHKATRFIEKANFVSSNNLVRDLTPEEIDNLDMEALTDMAKLEKQAVRDKMKVVKQRSPYFGNMFHRFKSEANYLKTELQNKHIGNCGEMSAYMFFYLYERLDPSIRLDYVSIENGDHAFLVVNRAWNSDINDPNTWGKGAMIFDPWTYRFFPASEYLNKLKDYKGTTEGAPKLKKFNPKTQKLVIQASNFPSSKEFRNNSLNSTKIINSATYQELGGYLREFHKAQNNQERASIAKKIINHPKVKELVARPYEQAKGKEIAVYDLYIQMEHFLKVSDGHYFHEPKEPRAPFTSASHP
jgi:hypothetical protein